MLTYVKLPAFGSRDQWITVLCAVQDWSEKSPEGFEIFHEWSATQPGYVSEEDCYATWQSFEPGGGIGIGTLIKLARDGGWGEPVVPIAPVAPSASLAEQMAAPASSDPIPDMIAPVIRCNAKISPLLVAAQHALSGTGRARFEHSEAIHWLANEFVMILDQDGLYYSLTERMTMEKSVIDDLLTRYMPLNANHIPTNATLLMRRYGVVNIVNSQGFFPGVQRIYTENGRTYVNLYTDPPDMLVPTMAEAALIADLWDYAFPRPEDKIFGQYLLQFYAHVVQRPSVKLASAALMISKEFGTGKTTIMYDIPTALVGISNARMVSNKVLRSSFSDYIEGAQFLHFDEVYINGKWDSDDTANSLKNLVTGSNVEIHPKGFKPYNIPNRIFITATSNYEDAISIPADDERRWGIYYLRPTRGYTTAEREAYFDKIHALIRSPRGPGVLRYIFSQIDLTGFNPNSPPPVTYSKLLMAEKSQQHEIQILADAFRNDEGPFAHDVFVIEEVSQYLHSQTGKTYSNVACRGFLTRGAKAARALRQLRGNKTQIRPYACRDHAKWEQATSDQIRDELKR